LPCGGQVTIFQCYRRAWWGIIQCSSTSRWIRQRLTGLKRVFYHLKSVECERSELWKGFGLVPNEKNERLDFAA